MKLKSGMRGAGLVFAFGVLMIGSEAAQAPAGEATSAAGVWPLWAYPVTAVVPLVTDAGSDDAPLEHVSGSTAGYTKTQIADLFVVPDWFPDSHPAMPRVVAVGRSPVVFACGHCHLPNGLGRPENESVAGLPADYIAQQVADFKNDLRRSSEPRMAPANKMIQVAKAANAEEVEAAAKYFSSLKPQKWIRVVETGRVPVTQPDGTMLVADRKGATEAIGERVIEVAEDFEQTELRNPASGFVAYVPVGSLKEGKTLVRTGGHRRIMACTVCHGQNLRGQHLQGMGTVPSIRGRSPSQMARQLIDFRSGARHGTNSALMRMLAPRLTNADIVAITAYLASLDPESDH
ncbi:MAG: c-type cytochrome [Acidobacteriota bacterium]|nr:c-type cytochrome [Acidobacteriota bacterium]